LREPGQVLRPPEIVVIEEREHLAPRPDCGRVARGAGLPERQRQQRQLEQRDPIHDRGGVPAAVVAQANLERRALLRHHARERVGEEARPVARDDDLWQPQHLAGLAQAFADPEVGLAWRDCDVVRERVTEDGTRVALERRTLARDWDDRLMRSDDYLPPSTFAIRRSLFESLGGFDVSFQFSEDWDLLLRAAAAARVSRVPGVTAEVRIRAPGGAESHANASASFGPERRACLQRLAARHGFDTPEPKTFWEVALELGSE